MFINISVTGIKIISKFCKYHDNIIHCSFFNLTVIFFSHYFALATNPGEQFHNFSCIAAWLINMSGRQFDTPQEVIFLSDYSHNDVLFTIHVCI